jgi:hypothetical protein
MGAKYVFRVNELRNTIMSCIENTDEFFPDILDIRNPYNNIAFSSCDLYNFYFFLKTHNYSIHSLLHGFFLSNFDVVRYVEDYEVLIRDKAINDHAMRGIVAVLYPTVFRMLVEYRKHIKYINIAAGFPKKKLVDVMRPYLYLYLITLHYPNLPKRFDSRSILTDRLSEFDSSCPNFGQRAIIPQMDGGCIIRYVATRPNFYRLRLPIEAPIVIIDNVNMSHKDDILFNRIEENKTIDAWCDDNQIPSDVDDGTYVTDYYIRAMNKENYQDRVSDDDTDDDTRTYSAATLSDDSSIEDDTIVDDTTVVDDLDELVSVSVQLYNDIESEIAATMDATMDTTMDNSSVADSTLMDCGISDDNNEFDSDEYDTGSVSGDTSLVSELLELSLSHIHVAHHLIRAEGLHERITDMIRNQNDTNDNNLFGQQQQHQSDENEDDDDWMDSDDEMCYDR